MKMAALELQIAEQIESRVGMVTKKRFLDNAPQDAYIMIGTALFEPFFGLRIETSSVGPNNLSR